MFQPPETTTGSFNWRQLLGFDQGDDPSFTRIRIQQVAALYRQTHFNLMALLVNGAMLTVVLAEHPRAAIMQMWLGGALLLSIVWHVRTRPVRLGRVPMTGSPASFWYATFETAMFGGLWAVMLAVMLPLATGAQQSLMLLLSSAAVAAIGFAAAIMPVAAIAAVTVITLACMAFEPAMSMPLVIALITLWLLVARGSLLTTRALFARLRAEADLNERNAVIQLLLKEFEANGSDWLLEVNATGHITHLSPRFAEALGQPVDAIIGRHFLSVMGVKQIGDAAVAELKAAFTAGRPFRDLVVPAMVGGTLNWWSLSATPKLGPAGQFMGLRGIARDITELRRGEERIARLARFDPLTGLANRSLFRETLEDVLQRPGNGARRCALLFLDLDRFKQINDSMGHGAGDKLLAEVATRMRTLFDGGVTLARLGGDEFAVIMPGVASRRVAARADALVKALAQPFEIDGQHVMIGGSVGWSMAPNDGTSAEPLLKAADLALYEAKAAGRGVAMRYVDDMRSRAEARRALESALPGAIARGELSLEYQPIVDASDERIVCFEALLRWNHPQLGRVTPDRFIPVAEESGLIMEIGQWVINEACCQAATWPETIGIAVNVSPAQMDDPRLVEVVAAALARHALAPHRLELEITERMFLEETPETVSRLAALNALGIRFVLDDFGTGYSSLGYLKKAVFSRIKIDRSFVSKASDGGEATAIIDAIVKLASRLDMTTTAEGAETRAEFETCRDLGCARAQGYLFGRPMPAEAAQQQAMRGHIGSRVGSGALVA